MSDGSGMTTAQARMTQDGAILGTPLFLTPEQALGETEKIGPQTDQWPMGLIACELLTGASYWSEEQMTTLLAKIIFKQLLPPSAKGVKLGPRFDEWFLRSCAREPGDRWPSVGAQIEALADAMDVDRAVLTAAEPPPALRAWLSSRMMRAALAQPAEISLENLTGATLPARPSAALAPVAVGEASSEVLVVEPAAGGAPRPFGSSQRRGLTTVVYSGLFTVAVVLGGLGLLRLRTVPPPVQTAGPPDRSVPAPLVPPVAPAGPIATTPPSGPSDSAAEVAEPVETSRVKNRRGSLRNKPAGSRPHGKKHGRPGAPGEYDPVAP